MIDLNKKDCCGCEACHQACRRNCIEMKIDDEGFSYPQVDINRCVRCELCIRSCPVLNKIDTESFPTTVFVAKNMNEGRMISSSGGIFLLLAEYILSVGGVVFGAAFDEKWCVQHISCNERESLNNLLGSKYLQSRNNDSYRECKKMLTKDIPVLYVGTPCQVAGLKSYLGKTYEHLYLVDILCHGVPSPGVWKKYIDELLNKYRAHIKRVSFRDKDTGWHDYSLTVSFANGRNFSEIYYKNVYMRMFLENAILRPSCYCCKFKGIDERVSDITIGDAWGIEKISPDFDDNKGTSVIMIHSRKGNEIIELLKSQIVIKDICLDQILPADSDSRKSVKMNKGRALLFDYFKRNKSIDKMMQCLGPGIKYKLLRKVIRNK